MRRGVIHAGLWATALAGLAGFGGARWLAGWMERRVVGGIQSLTAVAERVRREENFTVRAPGAGPDELGKLIAEFNEMLAHIHLRDVELRRHRDHLGDLVAQRTAELMQLNHALIEARDRAQGASQAKSSFLANMSHELRTPLNAIKVYSELLIEEAQAEGRTSVIEDLQRINKAGLHLLALINEVLDVSKIEAGKMTLSWEEFDLAALGRETLDAVRPQADKNQNRVELDAPPTRLTMKCDLTKVRQMLLNLVGNAVKFTERGVVRLHLRTEE